MHTFIPITEELPMSTKEYLSQNEVAEAIELTTRTIFNLRRKGKFPEPIKHGEKKLRWHRDQIEAWKRGGTDGQSAA